MNQIHHLNIKAMDVFKAIMLLIVLLVINVINVLIVTVVKKLKIQFNVI